ncbi:MAG: 4Fe-4S dicluster domain-containing protein [Coriobacteriales bacterium]|jgi:ferredoxin-type protein NapG|nr:4Fe-4S dicluster domain-containing protein [Coriobacteriales bacterium]
MSTREEPGVPVEEGSFGQSVDTTRQQGDSGDGTAPFGMTRRTAVLGAGGAVVMLGLGGLSFIGNDPIIRPPGGQDEDRLVSACIRCERCYEICPRNVIAPTHIENGLLNMRTPTLDFSDDFCDWCTEKNGGEDPLCVKVCPTEALSLPQGATALDTMLGKAVINTDWCLAYKLIGCRFCYDACPYEAMELDENNRPVVLYDICNGCGACECVCVSLQNGSISEGADEVAIVIRAIDENGDVVPRKTGFPF